ncbi:Signal transduction histidine kinase [Sphingomonas sp. NFR04]|uniref:response regulator n=1 Tax=Sphingomonas sp. NFR04 TaxID=1566283 RepID=UPI0008E679E8|nr:response regulator [Sphingomonas sp. NFR04]SFJ66417.1 Signal transduction histidine kinase [Sphingomonas sp. NFR04]
MKRRNLLRDSGGRSAWTSVGLVVGLAFFLISGALAYRNVLALGESDAAIRHSHTVLIALDELLSTVQDAETGQRGYLLTGGQGYLEPYTKATETLDGRLDHLQNLVSDNDVQQSNIVQLRRQVGAKLAELRETIDVRRKQGLAEALAIVETDRGKNNMDAIRAQLAAMAREEGRLRQERLDDMAAASQAAIASGLVSSLIGAALTLMIFVLVRRNLQARAREEWLQNGLLGISAAVRGDRSVEEISEAVLGYLADKLGFQAGALFKGEAGVFRRVATLGVPGDADVPEAFGLREGLLGRVAAEGKPILLDDVPDHYLEIGSAFGSDKPRHLMIVPAKADDMVNAVLELGFFYPTDPMMLELLERASPAIGVALRSARFRAQLQDALEETQRQAAELQTQSEELQVNNEELEEQGRALRESQAMLEQQQVELEQTNSQLEEQAQALEHQRDELERGSAALLVKTQELEQASQYKSDFLANMSHELRTPLNSLLILAKLLGDNGPATLTAEQVKFARTIESSGNDLLTLINDILDLSKIEAGHVDIRPEPVSLVRLGTDLRQVFQPVAEQRGLDLEIVLDETAPKGIETDRMRLEQILKNLLSNALKFTEKGSVKLQVRAAGDRITFAVRDTGIGISPEQQRMIFEAFHQADGTINRRYGGTGLGLSISRELARLLGGGITLESRAGEGSTFTLTLPLRYDAEAVAPRALPAAPAAPAKPVAPPAPAAMPAPPRRAAAAAADWVLDDDRDRLVPGGRHLLVIEDDPVFASIVCDLSRELGFQCLVASTADEALQLARSYRPSAVVLDLGLPDQSGLIVLDQLKQEDSTRHIPIHVISAADQSQTALSLGAVGYHIKPIKRELLAEVLQNLQARTASHVRRVLIVEDDDVQRDAVAQLLQKDDVETVGVRTAAECLQMLRSQTFDCMVLDLSLPDASGYSLLETLSEEDGSHSFPPVIVYTGHDLSADDEQKLRRYSSSIIIKGAKSPERLLDEVSLFLHQVVSELPSEQQEMIQAARRRDAVLEGRRVLIVEDDVRNVYSLTSVLEPRGVLVRIARNGQEALDALAEAASDPEKGVDLALMDVMMPVMDGLTATRAIRQDSRWARLPIIMLTAKAMPDDQERCIEAGASDYMAKPIDVDKLLSLVRVWMPR